MRFMVDLHTHTLASSHAYSTIAEYVNQAVDKGILMFACTDHGPALEDAPHPWHFGNLRVVPHIIDGVAVLRGIEANITKEGDIDLEQRYLDKLDIVLAGFHPNLEPSDKDTNTKLVMQVIKSNKVDVITHLGNVNYPIDMEAVLECAKEHNVAIEINSSSSVNTRANSHDNCVQIAKLAKSIGNIIALGSDSHIAYFLGNFNEAVRVIEEAELSYEQVINTSPVKVLEFLKDRGHSNLDDLYHHFCYY